MSDKKDEQGDGSENVIGFPKKHIRPEILDAEILRRHERGKEYYIIEVIGKFLDQATEAYIAFGIDIFSEEYQKDFQYFQNAVAGIFYKSVDLHHPTHDIVETAKQKILENGESVWVFEREVTSNSSNTKTVIVKT